MRASSILLVICAFAAFSACDIVDQPVDPTWTPPPGTGKKALVEDFTGHQCGNCPQAHVTGQTLINTYGDDVVVVGVHVGGFAATDPDKGYVEDFTTPHGNLVDSVFNCDIYGLPVGMVNRIPIDGEVRLRHSNWSTAVAQVLAETPRLTIDLSASYTEADRKVDVTADLSYLADGTAEHQIVALITEDSVLSKQSDYSLIPPYINDYYQMHVLRKSLTTGVFGNPVKGAPIFTGEEFTFDFTTTLDTAWRAGHCSVVVYVTDVATKEILQVEQYHLQ